MSSRTLLEMFGHIVFSFTRGVAEHYNPDEPEFTPELFGYNAFDYTARSLAWYFKVDEMIYQEYSDRQHTTLDCQAASGFRVRVNDACLPNENEGMQESQPLVEADTAMAWKRLRPSVLATVSITFRLLQADLDSLKSIATIGIIHGSAEVIERSAIVFIDHICHMIWKRSSAPWGHFRTPRRERLMADIVIISMLYEAAAIVCVNSVWFLYQWVYIEGDFPLHLFVEFALRTSIALVIEWFFSSVSLTIVTRYQNMAAMAVWRKRWKRHILVALVNSVPLALWLNKYLMQIVSRRFDDPKQSCKMPFT
ncbi:PREDICTED: uncharacterized protein LOC107354723 isoform X2 [Acropora digitifera]|uniref:uncharacterized protein LOC107354723 isoform X2 n=1 Tax=Acropora digitifera TaxID=70779 RepID=UPI00077A32C0|nr:PREDICTED: uncharacterized protein LOC107354723 isoform X2 [Acropora digitifera]